MKSVLMKVFKDQNRFDGVLTDVYVKKLPILFFHTEFHIIYYKFMSKN